MQWIITVEKASDASKPVDVVVVVVVVDDDDDDDEIFASVVRITD